MPSAVSRASNFSEADGLVKRDQSVPQGGGRKGPPGAHRNKADTENKRGRAEKLREILIEMARTWETMAAAQAERLEREKAAEIQEWDRPRLAPLELSTLPAVT